MTFFEKKVTCDCVSPFLSTRAAVRFSMLLLSIVVLSAAPIVVSAETDAERRARLESELQNVERQILTQRMLVEDKQLERQSLERDVSLIEGQIKQAQLGIQARALHTAFVEKLGRALDDFEDGQHRLSRHRRRRARGKARGRP